MGTGCAGQNILLTAHITIFNIIYAADALSFSVYNLVTFAGEYGREQQQQRAALSEPLFASTEPSHAFEYDDSLFVVTNCPSRPETLHWRWLAPFYDDNPRARYWVESVFPRISEAHRKTESCVAAQHRPRSWSSGRISRPMSSHVPLSARLTPLPYPPPATSYIDATKASSSSAGLVGGLWLATKASIRSIIGAPQHPSSPIPKL